MADYDNAFKKLSDYDAEIAIIVADIYKSVSSTLKELIVNEESLRKAQTKLLLEYEKAIKSNNVKQRIIDSTVSVIVDSSYVSDTLGGTRENWAEYIYRNPLFEDGINLSTRIRENYDNIIADQRIILRKSLKEGKTIAQIIGNIAEDNIKGFKTELPKYIEELKKAKIIDGKLSSSQIASVRKQISKLKTDSLKADYNRLIDSIELGKGIDKATYYALERRTKYYTNRLARTESIRAMAIEETYNALKDENTRFVKTVTQGSNPCPYCVAMESLGFMPVESASIPTHHPHCSCKPVFRKSIKKPEKIKTDDFISMQQLAIDRENAKNEREGKSKSYIKPVKPDNLRTNRLYSEWNEYKNS